MLLLSSYIWVYKEWIPSYSHQFSSVLQLNEMPRLATYKTLSIAKKLEILEETKKNCSDREIAKKYGIAPVTIRDWRKQELKLKEEKFNGRGCSKKLIKTQTMHYFPKMEITVVRLIWKKSYPFTGRGVIYKKKISGFLKCFCT